jgi:hypothetical protein
MSKYTQLETIEEDDDTGGDSGRGEATSRKPFRMHGYLVQEELAKGEKKFGDIDYGRRDTDPPPPETLEQNYTEEDQLAAENGNVAEVHPFLNCQQFDGRDPVRDPRIPSLNDLISYAENNPQAQLTLNPELRLALENAKRNQLRETLSLKPAGM